VSAKKPVGISNAAKSHTADRPDAQSSAAASSAHDSGNQDEAGGELVRRHRRPRVRAPTVMTVRAMPEDRDSTTHQLAAGLVCFRCRGPLSRGARLGVGRSAVWLFAALLIPTGFLRAHVARSPPEISREAPSWGRSRHAGPP